VYAENPNTINYDNSAIVFHEWPVFEVTPEGKTTRIEDTSGVSVLSSKIDQMQKSITVNGWRVNGPAILNLRNLSDGSTVQSALSMIDGAAAQAGVSDSASLYDYLKSVLSDNVNELDIPLNAKKAVLSRLVEEPGAPSLTDVKRLVPKQKQQAVSEFVKNSDSLVTAALSPIQRAIQTVAIEALKGLKSALINDTDREIARLKTRVERAISAIKSSGNTLALEVLEKEMRELGSAENVNAAMEGLVFFYKGQAYKLTGLFANVHQLLSLFTYGRKGIPKMDLGEAQYRSALTIIERWNVNRRALFEGGHAFDDVVPIELSDFETTFKNVKKDLETLGCTDIRLLGSSGKKQESGDIDVAVKCELSRGDLKVAIEDVLGVGSTRTVGSNIVSVRYPIYGANDKQKGSFVQVDVMLGKPAYLAWSRFGTSTMKNHPDFSPLKGTVRNILLNTVTRIVSQETFPGKDEFERTRYTIDFDAGLFKTTQTKKNKLPGKPPLKDWKTLDRELITDDPDEIARAIFGRGVKSSDLRRFEDVIAVIKRSPKLTTVSSEIFDAFLAGFEEFLQKNADKIGMEPREALAYVREVIES
jgi:hypothetical protein